MSILCYVHKIDITFSGEGGEQSHAILFLESGLNGSIELK
jgi:hypothetical protein